MGLHVVQVLLQALNLDLLVLQFHVFDIEGGNVILQGEMTLLAIEQQRLLVFLQKIFAYLPVVL